MAAVELGGIVLLSALTRALFLLRGSTDLDVHLWLLGFYRRGGGFRRKDVENAFKAVNQGYVGYPPIPHVFLARLPERLALPVGIALNYAYDSLTIMAFYFLAAWADAHFAYPRLSALLSKAALFTLVFATAPIMHPVTARLTAMSGRSLGGLLTFLYFLCFGAARVFDLPLWYVACVPLGVATLLSSQFGLQVLALFSLGLSLYFLSFVPAGVFLASVAAGLAVPGLGLRRQLEAKLAHYRWYMTRFPGRGIDDRNNLAMLVKLPLYLVQEPNKAVTYLFYKLTPFILPYSVPVILVMGIELWSEPGTWGRLRGDPIQDYCLGIAVVSLGVFALTSIGPFLFLGQAERYFEYSLPFVTLLAADVMIRSGYTVDAIYVLILFQIGFCLLNLLVANRAAIAGRMQPFEPSGMQEVIAFLGAQPPRRIVCIPTKLGSRVGVRLAERHAMYYFGLFRDDSGLQHYFSDHIAHHLMKPDLQHFAEIHGVDTIIAEREYSARYRKEGVDFRLPDESILFQNRGYVVYDVQRALAVAPKQVVHT